MRDTDTILITKATERMSGKFAKLKTDWLLRGWSDIPWVVVNWTNGDQRQLNKKGFYVIQACDGETDFDSIAFLPTHHAMLDKLIDEGIAERCAEGDSLATCQQYRKAKTPWLSGLHWSVTGLCNLKCRHCYMEAPSGRYGELSWEDTIRVIEQLEEANIHEVSLTGGEPFLRKDLPDIIAVLAKKRICVSEIFTNGLYISKEILEGIKGVGVSPRFQISYDGRGTHEHMRGVEGIEHAVIAAIRKVRTAGFKAVISTSIDKTNKDSIRDTYDLLKALDVQAWRISRPQEIGRWKKAGTQISLEEEVETYSPLLERWLKDEKPFAIQFGDLFTFKDNSAANSETMSGIHYTFESFDCGNCREKPFLLPDGVLLPCPAYTDTALQSLMPNVRREGFSKAWNDPVIRAIVERRKGDMLEKNEECRLCELFGECGMGCRAIALTITGDLMLKNPIACEIAKKGYMRLFRQMAS